MAEEFEGAEPNVAVLVIEHQHGSNIYVCADPPTARQQLFRYVEENWVQEMGAELMPSSADEATARYFEVVEEAHHTSEQPILGAKGPMDSVTVLRIGPEHAYSVFVCANKSLARQVVYQYVEDNWHTTGRARKPKDPARAARSYFQQFDMNGPSESQDIFSEAIIKLADVG